MKVAWFHAVHSTIDRFPGIQKARGAQAERQPEDTRVPFLRRVRLREFALLCT